MYDGIEMQGSIEARGFGAVLHPAVLALLFVALVCAMSMANPTVSDGKLRKSVGSVAFESSCACYKFHETEGQTLPLDNLLTVDQALGTYLKEHPDHRLNAVMAFEPSDSPSTQAAVTVQQIFLVKARDRQAQRAIWSEIEQRLQTAKESELISVTITLREQLDVALTREVAAHSSQEEVQKLVQTKLRQLAALTQEELVARLRSNPASAGEVTSLWVTNALSARLSKEAITALAADPSVASIRLDEPQHVL